VGVGDISRDEPVPIERDGRDIENGRRTAEYVGRCPEITQYTTKTPLTVDNLLHTFRAPRRAFIDTDLIRLPVI